MSAREQALEQVSGQVSIEDILTAQTPVTLDDWLRDVQVDDPQTRAHVDRYLQAVKDTWDKALQLAEGIVDDYARSGAIHQDPGKALGLIRAALAANRWDAPRDPETQERAG